MFWADNSMQKRKKLRQYEIESALHGCEKCHAYIRKLRKEAQNE
jgi:hypothetical protein